MLLSELLRDVDYTGTIKDTEIKNVTGDSRQVEPGSVFVCIKGATVDGHEYAKAAVRSGASWIVAERDTGVENQVLVPNTRAAYAVMCANINGRPAEKMKLIGVTGTNGKTTITYLMKPPGKRSGSSERYKTSSATSPFRRNTLRRTPRSSTSFFRECKAPAANML